MLRLVFSGLSNVCRRSLLSGTVQLLSKFNGAVRKLPIPIFPSALVRHHEGRCKPERIPDRRIRKVFESYLFVAKRATISQENLALPTGYA